MFRSLRVVLRESASGILDLLLVFGFGMCFHRELYFVRRSSVVGRRSSFFVMRSSRDVRRPSLFVLRVSLCMCVCVCVVFVFICLRASFLCLLCVVCLPRLVRCSLRLRVCFSYLSSSVSSS